MCMVCEHMLYEEHRRAEEGPFDPCPKCRKFPSNEGKACYHCFSVGEIVDECPECAGKGWSEDFLAAKAIIEPRRKAAADHSLRSIDAGATASLSKGSRSSNRLLRCFLEVRTASTPPGI